MTGWPAFIKNSADRAPLAPVEKFSTLLTVFFSRGTEVPPLVINTMCFPSISLKLLYVFFK